VYSDILFLLTNREFSPAEAKQHWFEIVEHQTTLRNALNREPGFQVAMVDYFTNVHPLLGHLVFVDINLLMQKERASLLDDLTGLYNRRFFDRALKKEFEQAKRFGHAFAVLIVQANNLEEYYEKLGPDSGNQLVSELSSALLSHTRTIDHLVRYSTNEFVVLLPRSDRSQARSAAERHVRAVEDQYFPGEENLDSGKLTITISLASYPEDAETGPELLKIARDKLHRLEDTPPNQVLV
jgi:diguanylate cyclase (GGDEF)-like protein